MAERAKIFKTGGSQAVRLPKPYRFEEGEEVLIYQQGRRVILEPQRRTWSRRFLELPDPTIDFPYPDEPAPDEPLS